MKAGFVLWNGFRGGRRMLENTYRKFFLEVLACQRRVGTKILHIMLFSILKVSGDFLKIQNVLISL